MIVGVLGAGQLGQMLRDAGERIGVGVALYDLGQFDSAGLTSFLADVDVATFETENVSEAILAVVESSGVKASPSVDAVRVCQHRLREKQLLRSLGIATAPFAEVVDEASLRQAVEQLGFPLILKTQTEGYDGKGQALVRDEASLLAGWEMLKGRALIAEGFVNFSRELSIVAARSADGQMAFYDLVENHHHQGILRYTLAPAPDLTETLAQQGQDYIARLMQHFDYVGVMALELFVTAKGLVANEIAPRVHNSGHWSMEGATASQFENHLRAIAGLPLGATARVADACGMVNVIGDETPCAALQQHVRAEFHSYGKSARPGRKLGHVNIAAHNAAERASIFGELSALMPDAVAAEAVARAALR